MRLNITAELNGKEIADQLLHEIKTNHGIVVNDGTVKCFVFSEKANKEVEVELDKIKFIFNRN